MKRKLKPIEFLIFSSVAAYFYITWTPVSVPAPKTKHAATTPPSPKKEIPKTIITREIPLTPNYDPKKGSLFTSWSGDPCRVASVEHDYHPKGFPKGTELKNVNLRCTGKDKNFSLSNVGVYQHGKLVSWSRKRIEDGNCHLLTAERVSSKENHHEAALALLSCSKEGKTIWLEILNVKGENSEDSQYVVRDPASAIELVSKMNASYAQNTKSHPTTQKSKNK